MDEVTHVSYAYRLKTEQHKLLEGFNDDGEYGLGRKLLSSIIKWDNLFVAVARWHKGPNLGQRRFDIALSLAAEAINELIQPPTKT